MTDIVVVIQKSSSQSEIWTRLLRSQGLVVIQESPEVNLRKLLQEASEAHQILPKLIIVEMSIEKLNPYEFCRWTHQNHPDLKVILTAQERIQVSEIEQRWAKNQGAYQLLPGFDYGHLPLSLTQGMELVMLALDKTDWEPASLVPLVEELTAEFGNNGEEKTFLQASEDVAEETALSSETTETHQESVAASSSHKRRGLKVKPKVKRFRGLPY
ncbi:response regulator receiver domain-containing protein [Halothece sp. PCC 7418]|uniref:response regulator receiver domain-containing protein n=1 Tax=Halothece sp. (strain PCC 7418) TaxID=65093 RepID=UPI0002A063C6|nr:response regulator receiver domain-containing protein [Halothece sp. PCC 7418]AFZ43987.1 response regulator receiver domain-containing protein [Halothece sp. PCC 7418]